MQLITISKKNNWEGLFPNFCSFFSCAVTNSLFAASESDTANSKLQKETENTIQKEQTPPKANNNSVVSNYDTPDSTPTNHSSSEPTTPSSPSAKVLTNTNLSATNNAVCEPSDPIDTNNKSSPELPSPVKENNKKLEELYDIPVGKFITSVTTTN